MQPALSSLSKTDAAVSDKISYHKRKVVFIQGSLLLLLLTLCVCIPVLYVSYEHTIHFWDQASYQDMAMHKAVTLRNMPDYTPINIARQVRDIYQSTARNYSDLHTLLVSPFILLFGPSRFVYLIALSLVYVLPFVLIMSRMASSLVMNTRIQAFWVMATITIVTPATWLPTFNGYPDTGSAFLICVAMYMYLQDTELKTWWRMLVISFCLALSVLFRRHFAYDVVAFFCAVSLHTFILKALSNKGSLLLLIRKLFRAALPIAFMGLGMVAFLILLGWPFVERLLYTSFSELYASYERSASDNFLYYLSFYGWISILLAVCGFTVSLITKPTRIISSPKALFILLFGLTTVFLWIFKVKQLGFHYSMHFTPCILSGCFAAVWFIKSAFINGKRRLLLSVVACYMVINGLITFIPNPFNTPMAATIGNKPLQTALSAAFPYNYSPSRRTDYDQINNLLRFLHRVASEKDPIYIAASSDIINADLIWHANRLNYENVMSLQPDSFWDSQRLNVLQWVPFADSQDSYPVEKLLQSRFVIVTTPVQYHMRKEEQEVVNVVVTAFREKWLFSKDFKLLPQTFTLANQTIVHIYERIRPTSLQTAIQTLQKMKDYMDTPPGGQLAWMAFNASATSYIAKNYDGTYKISVQINEQTTPLQFLYITGKQNESLLKADILLTDIKKNNTSIILHTIDDKGSIVSSKEYPLNGNNELTMRPEGNYSFVMMEFLVNNSVFTNPGKHWLIIDKITVQ